MTVKWVKSNDQINADLLCLNDLFGCIALLHFGIFRREVDELVDRGIFGALNRFRRTGRHRPTILPSNDRRRVPRRRWRGCRSRRGSGRGKTGRPRGQVGARLGAPFVVSVLMIGLGIFNLLIQRRLNKRTVRIRVVPTGSGLGKVARPVLLLLDELFRVESPLGLVVAFVQPILLAVVLNFVRLVCLLLVGVVMSIFKVLVRVERRHAGTPVAQVVPGAGRTRRMGPRRSRWRRAT